ncbi:MAG: MarR family winged helix-turn-helix transcriptional regulator, partial [Actinomycetes bacterium]
MDADLVAQVRRFNRLVTQRVGALSDRFLARDRSLGEARLLWEIGATGRDGRDVRSLRSQLGLDSGYLSRLLQALQVSGLISVGPKESDRRVRVARLTRRGHAERAVLDRRSDELAESILAPLSTGQQTRLTAAMAEDERLLTELELHTARHGAHALRRETNKSLVEAISLYQSAGFIEIEPYNDE